MEKVKTEADQVDVPAWVVDLESFRRWTETDEFPEKGDIGYFNGKVWVDMSKEQVFTHVLVKTRYASVLDRLVTTEKMGLFLTEGVYISNVEADLSCKPDGTFVSNAALEAGRVRLVEGMREGVLELEGAADMLLEVVSTSSVRKDTVDYRQAYWKAGVREYWLVDARSETPSFDIFRYTARGFRATRKTDGWVKSDVFGKSFRLVRTVSSLGHPDFNLEVR
jgi:hypothetical protein